MARGRLVRLLSAPPAAFRDRADLVVVGNTDEGDPVVSYFRSLPEGAVEVFTDASDDRYGSVDWSHQRCPVARSFDDLGTCTDVP